VSSDLTLSLTDTARQYLSEPQASLLGGILFGGPSHLPKDLVEALRTTGTLHVVAVSGQNMSILAGMVGSVGRFLGWRISLVFQGLALVGYIWLVGGGASVIRSGLMALISLLAVSTGRQYDAARALAIVGVSMAALHPDYLSDVGWQLSVAATAGIIWLSPLIQARLDRYSKPLSSIVSVSLAAQLVTWPIIAANFGMVSLIGVLANAVVEWAVPWIMALGALSLLIGQLAFGLGQVLSWLVLVPLTYFVGVVKLLAQFPFAKFDLAGLPMGVVVIYYTLVVGLSWKWQPRKAS